MHDRIKNKKQNVVHTLGLSVIYSIGYRTIVSLHVCVCVGGRGGGERGVRLAGLRKE